MPALNEQRRDNAIRLLKLFASAGTCGAAMDNAWVLNIATESGLADQELLSGLGYAAEQNWLTVEQKGLLLTEAGKVAAITGKIAA